MSKDVRSRHHHRVGRLFIILLSLILGVTLANCSLEETMPILPSVTFLPSRTILTPVFSPTAFTTTPSPVPSTATQTPTPTIATVEICIVSVGAAYLRAGAAIQNRIVGYAYQGDQLSILEHSQDSMWLRVDYQEEAWISASLVEIMLVTVTPMETGEFTVTPEITNTLTITPAGD